MGFPTWRAQSSCRPVNAKVTVASRSRGPIDAAVALRGHGRRRSPPGWPRRSELVILCVPSSPDVAIRGRGHAGRARRREGRRRLLHHRPRRRAGPARTGLGHGRRVPRRAGVRWDGGGGQGDPHPDGRGGRRHPGGCAPGPRALRRPHRPRRGPGDGPGGQAVQQPDLRGADGGDGRGDRDGREVRRGPRQVPRCPDPCDRRLRGCADPASRCRGDPREPSVQRLEAWFHDRPHGQGPRSGPGLRGPHRCAADHHRHRPPDADAAAAPRATGARTSRPWPRWCWVRWPARDERAGVLLLGAGAGPWRPITGPAGS